MSLELCVEVKIKFIKLLNNKADIYEKDYNYKRIASYIFN